MCQARWFLRWTYDGPYLMPFTGTPVEDQDSILKLLRGVSHSEIKLGVGIYSEWTRMETQFWTIYQSWICQVNLLQVLHLFLWFLTSLFAGVPSINRWRTCYVFNKIDGVHVTGSLDGSRTVYSKLQIFSLRIKLGFPFISIFRVYLGCKNIYLNVLIQYRKFMLQHPPAS